MTTKGLTAHGEIMCAECTHPTPRDSSQMVTHLKQVHSWDDAKFQSMAVMCSYTFVETTKTLVERIQKLEAKG